MQFLLFDIHAIMASFGTVAASGMRPSDDRPSRSQTLGLIGNCLGLDRGDLSGLGALEEDLGFAVATLHAGRSIVDFHTVMIVRPEDGDDRQPQSRREAMARAGKIHSDLSFREWLNDAWHVACIWSRSGNTDVGTIASALRRPARTPFVGRMSGSFSVPLDPRLIDAADPVSALKASGVERKWLRLFEHAAAIVDPMHDSPRPWAIRLSKVAVDADAEVPDEGRVHVVERMDSRRPGSLRHHLSRRERVIEYDAIGRSR